MTMPSAQGRFARRMIIETLFQGHRLVACYWELVARVLRWPRAIVRVALWGILLHGRFAVGTFRAGASLSHHHARHHIPCGIAIIVVILHKNRQHHERRRCQHISVHCRSGGPYLCGFGCRVGKGEQTLRQLGAPQVSPRDVW